MWILWAIKINMWNSNIRWNLACQAFMAFMLANKHSGSNGALILVGPWLFGCSFPSAETSGSGPDSEASDGTAFQGVVPLFFDDDRIIKSNWNHHGNVGPTVLFWNVIWYLQKWSFHIFKSYYHHQKTQDIKHHPWDILQRNLTTWGAPDGHGVSERRATTIWSWSQILRAPSSGNWKIWKIQHTIPPQVFLCFESHQNENFTMNFTTTPPIQLGEMILKHGNNKKRYENNQYLSSVYQLQEQGLQASLERLGAGISGGELFGMTWVWLSFPETNISIHITYITWKVGGIEDESSCWRWFFLSLRAVMIQGGYEYNMRISCMFDLLMGLLWQQDWNGYKGSSLHLNQIQHHNHTRLGTSGILHLLAIVIGDQWLIIAAEETACENDVKLNLNLNEC